MYINHMTLNTGHTSRIERGDVAGETLARISPWLEAAILIDEPSPLPVASLATYSAQAYIVDGGLLCDLFGPPNKATHGEPLPLVSMGVAKRSRHGAAIWPQLVELPGIKRGIVRPPEPWCAAVLLPTLAHDMSAAMWLGDLERCIAWAWVTRPEG